MNPRWYAGWSLAIQGIEFRVRDGRKADGDLVLEWLTPDGWQAIPMSAALMLNDFHYCVEDHLYPPEHGYKGGRFFLDYVRHACRHGWPKAWAGVTAAKADKHRPPELFDA